MGKLPKEERMRETGAMRHITMCTARWIDHRSIKIVRQDIRASRSCRIDTEGICKLDNLEINADVKHRRLRLHRTLDIYS